MKILFIIICITSLTACNQHTIKTTQSLSREYTTVQFSSSNKPYVAKQQVGGEQINTTTIKAKANEIYFVHVKANNTNLNFNIDGEFLHSQTLGNNPLNRQVTTTAQTDITLSFTAHPDSSFYELKITKL